MIKLAHVVTSYTSVVTILDSKLRALDEYEDIDLTVISSGPEGEKRRTAVRHIPVFMSRSIQPFKDIWSMYRLYKVFKEERFDIVHSHTAKAGFITAIAAKLAGVRCVCHTSHGLPFFDGQAKIAYGLYKMLEKTACFFRQFLFTQNRRDMEKCIELMGNPEKVLYEGNGVDVSGIETCAQEQVVIVQNEYPPIDGAIRLLMLSRLEPVKRPLDFIEIVQKLKEIGQPVSAVVGGDGVQNDLVRQRIKELNLEDCIHLLGFTEYPHGLIAASDIVILCSEKEGIPRAVLEAMALRKPVVATNVLGTQEVVSNAETGYLVPLGNIDAFVEKIIAISQNKELRNAFGCAAKMRILGHFNDRKIAEMLHTFYLKQKHSIQT